MADLRLRLVVPVLRLGPVTVDPIQAVAGQPLAALLGSVVEGQRPVPGGDALDLRLPDGVGAAVPLGPLGEAGLRNARGRLVLSVPLPLVGRVAEALGAYVVGRWPGVRFCEELAVELPVGVDVALPLVGVASLTVRRLG
jgi:hypothetical protein